jgi:hypothetical protein
MGRPKKFAALTKHLKQKATKFRDTGETDYQMTFTEIEDLGVALPPSAYKHRAWWSNNKYNSNNPYGKDVEKPWEGAKFDTQGVDMERGVLTFRYYGGFSQEDRARHKEKAKANFVGLRQQLMENRQRGILAPQSPNHLLPVGMADAGRRYSASDSEPPGSPPTCRHPLYGALKGYIRLVAGTDLTEPVDPEWGERIWGHDPE